MKLVYHFHGETVVESGEEIARLMEVTDPELVHLLYDTGHAYYGGSDPLHILRSYYDRIPYIHLKDVRQEVLDWKRQTGVRFREAVRRGIFTVPGDGCIDFLPIFQELSSRGYEGWIIIEAEQNPAAADPVLYARKAKNYLELLEARLP
jgi:inosose dehydratase